MIGINQKEQNDRLKELAWFFGILAGDGWVSVNKGIGLTNKSLPLVERWASSCKLCFGNLFRINPRINKIKNKYYTCTISNKYLAIFVGGWKEKTWDNDFKKNVWITSKKEYISSFLNAFFDAEGTISLKNRQLFLYSEQENIKLLIDCLFKKIDIESKIYKGGVSINKIYYQRRLAINWKSMIKKKEIEFKKFRYYKSNNEDDYIRVKNLNKKGLGGRKIEKLFPYIPRGTINSWLYENKCPYSIKVKESREDVF